MEAGEEEESLELGDHLYILLTNKFVMFKEFLDLQEYQLLQTLALNKEQFKKIVSFHPFLLTICPSLNKNWKNPLFYMCVYIYVYLWLWIYVDEK